MGKTSAKEKGILWSLINIIMSTQAEILMTTKNDDPDEKHDGMRAPLITMNNQ